MEKKNILIVLLTIMLTSLSARIMYVNHLLDKYDEGNLIYEGFLGNENAENKLLAMFRENQINKIVLFSVDNNQDEFGETFLSRLLSNTRNREDLISFIKKARDVYLINSVKIAVSQDFVLDFSIMTLLDSINENEIFINGVATEMEFWNNCTNDTLSVVATWEEYENSIEELLNWRDSLSYSFDIDTYLTVTKNMNTNPDFNWDFIMTVPATCNSYINNIYLCVYNNHLALTDSLVNRYLVAYQAKSEHVSPVEIYPLFSLQVGFLHDIFTEEGIENNLQNGFNLIENNFENLDEFSDYTISNTVFFNSTELQEIMENITLNCYVKGSVLLPETNSYMDATLFFDQVDDNGNIIAEDSNGIKIDSNGDFYKILPEVQFGFYQLRIDSNGETIIPNLNFNENQEEYDLGIIDLNSETVVYYVYSNIPIENATANFTNAYNNEIRETQTIDLIKGWNKLNFTFPGENPSNYYCNLIASGVAGETYSINSSHNYIFNNETDCYENDDIEFTFDNKLLHSGWNWESFPMLERTVNNPVLAVPEFESIYPIFDKFEWIGKYPTKLEEGYWTSETVTLQSSDGGQLQVLPANNRVYEANGTRLTAGTTVNLDVGWNWIGYWLPHSQMCDVAFGDNYDKVEKIKSEDWYVDKRNNNRYGSLPLPSYKPKPLHYGEGYYVYLTEEISSFSWANNETTRSDNFEKKEPDNFSYTKKADYEVIDVVDIDPEIQEIGVFENDVCVGGVKVDENSEQILIYSDRMNRETSKFTFEVITGRGDSQAILDYKIYNANEGDFAEGVILSGHQDYSIVKLGKRGENNVVSLTGSIIHNSYPNPFNPKTTISFDLPRSEIVDISIFNIKGQKVKTLISSFKEQGSHSVVWNGNDANGKTVGSGIFFYKIKTANETAVSKLLMLK